MADDRMMIDRARAILARRRLKDMRERSTVPTTAGAVTPEASQ